MIKRVIEDKDYLRASVEYIKLEEVKCNSLLFETFSSVTQKKQVSSADSQMFERRNIGLLGSKVCGRLQLDVLATNVLRIRYKQGDKIAANDTPMVVGSFKTPEKFSVLQNEDKLIVKTDRINIIINTNPYSISIVDTKRDTSIDISGGEKNYFRDWDAVGTGVCYGLKDGLCIATENFSLQHDECIYGFGEKFIKLNKVGQTIDLDTCDALGVSSPRSYKNIPFYISTNGYGVFFNHSSLMTFWVGSMSACDVQAAISDDFLDYYVFMGDIKEILQDYTTLTGKGQLPPKWTFGYWQSKISYSSAEETLDIVKNMRKNQIPCDVIHIDTNWFKQNWYCDLEFNKENFPDPNSYIKMLGDLGIKVSLWQLPYIPEGSELFENLKAVDGFVKDKNGGIYDVKICFTKGFNGIVGVIDFTNPKAIEIYCEALKKLFKLGIKAIKTDFGEAAPLDGVYYNGALAHQMHNLYPLLYNKVVFELTKEETGDKVVWARSAWAGSQRYPIHWGGDNSPNYMNMAPQLDGGLSLGLSGFQFWSQDIGGFLGDTNDKLLIRWMELGVFLSHIRIHGSGNREIYKFAPETMDICRRYIQLRYRLLPYIYGSARNCVDKSLPMAKPLVVEYQNDPNVWNISDEYLFGEDMLIAPIFNEKNKRSVYLPKGNWTYWWSKERITGGCWIEVEADLDTIPIYIREGAIIPMGPVMNYVDEVITDKIDLIICKFENECSSSFLMPVNDVFINIKYLSKDGKHIVEHDECDIAINILYW